MPPSWIDQPGAPRDGEELDHARLTAYLDSILGAATEVEIAQFPSGFSNLTYGVRVDGRELVLRRPPFGAKIKSAHDMGREFRILSGLAPVYPKVPMPVAFCEDPEVLGAPFYLMTRVEGVILRPGMPAAMEPAADLMGSIARTWAETLAELHAVDYEAAGLGDLGRPAGYVERQIAGWTGRYAAARTDEVPEIEAAAAWLAEHAPPEGAPALIHNDFKYDNVVLDPADWSRVLAVLDWEMATLGDPLMDLGTALGYWVDADDPPELQQLQLSPTTLPGNPGRAEIAQLYARAAGRELGDLVFYYVYGLFKIAVIVQQIYHRYRQGLTQDPRFAALDRAVRGCGLAAGQAIARGRIDRLFD